MGQVTLVRHIENAKNGVYQHWAMKAEEEKRYSPASLSQREFQGPVPLVYALRFVSEFPLHMAQLFSNLQLLLLGLRANASITGLLTVKSVSYSPMVLLGASSTGFQCQMFWVLCSESQS